MVVAAKDEDTENRATAHFWFCRYTDGGCFSVPTETHPKKG